MRDNISGRDPALEGDTTDHGDKRIACLGDRTTCGATLQKAGT